MEFNGRLDRDARAGWPVALLYPVALKVDGLACLVVGGGRVALRKAEALLECGAEVTVVAPETVPELDELPVRLFRRRYRRGDASGYRLAVTATGIPEVDRVVFDDGEKSGCLVNAADDIDACRFFMPSVIRRGPLTVSISTSGLSPYFAAWLRRRLEESIGPEYGRVLTLLGDARRRLQRAGRSTELACWDSLPVDELLADLAAGGDEVAVQSVNRWLEGEVANP